MVLCGTDPIVSATAPRTPIRDHLLHLVGAYRRRLPSETVAPVDVPFRRQVIDNCLDNDEMIRQYEQLTSDLLKWIKATIEELNVREFENSLVGVQRQLGSFNSYRIVEKPPRCVRRPAVSRCYEASAGCEP